MVNASDSRLSRGEWRILKFRPTFSLTETFVKGILRKELGPRLRRFSQRTTLLEPTRLPRFPEKASPVSQNKNNSACKLIRNLSYKDPLFRFSFDEHTDCAFPLWQKPAPVRLFSMNSGFWETNTKPSNRIHIRLRFCAEAPT